MLRKVLLVFLLFSFVALKTSGQTKLSEVAAWTIDALQNCWVYPNITYSIASGYECKLDVYRLHTAVPNPTIIYIHGGGWVAGVKEGDVIGILPYLEMGCSVVNVEYRLAKVALAPAAVEDCRLALRWVFKNAKTYGFDTTRVVVTGGSAGGHLALMTGMLNAAAGFDAPKNWDPDPIDLNVRAIINWYGITDVKDLLSGPDRQEYAVSWLGSQQNREELAERVSPLTYVRKDLPPILSIHGDNDNLVPYSHAVRLHKELNDKGVQNQLITIPGGKHGDFTRDQMLMIYANIRDFLKRNGVIR